jgi:uncharacterized protein YcbK (DUF882 family)
MIDPQLTKNFHIKEWRCHDGTGVPWNLVENVIKCATNLQALRDEVRTTVTIVSGFRSGAYNDKIGSKRTSQHIKGLAADIRVKGLRPVEVASLIETLIKDGRMMQGGLGAYSSFVHYDCRGTRARWNG